MHPRDIAPHEILLPVKPAFIVFTLIAALMINLLPWSGLFLALKPDFAALARAYGGLGETVTRTEAFAPALERALAADKPSLLHLVIDPQAVTMNATIDDLRRQATTRSG